MLYGTFQVCLSSGVRIWYVASDLAMNDDGRGIQLDCPWNKGEKQGVSEPQRCVDPSGSVMLRLRVINVSTCFLTEIILNSNELLLHPYSAG